MKRIKYMFCLRDGACICPQTSVCTCSNIVVDFHILLNGNDFLCYLSSKYLSRASLITWMVGKSFIIFVDEVSIALENWNGQISYVIVMTHLVRPSMSFQYSAIELKNFFDAAFLFYQSPCLIFVVIYYCAWISYE